MRGTHELFASWLEINLGLHVELETHAKCFVKGVGTVKFHLELGRSLEVIDVLYVLELKMNLASVLTFEDSGYVISFKSG